MNMPNSNPFITKGSCIFRWKSWSSLVPILHCSKLASQLSKRANGFLAHTNTHRYKYKFQYLDAILACMKTPRKTGGSQTYLSSSPSWVLIGSGPWLWPVDLRIIRILAPPLSIFSEPSSELWTCSAMPCLGGGCVQPMDVGLGNFRPRPGEVYTGCRERQCGWDAALDSGETLPPQVWTSVHGLMVTRTVTLCVALINPWYSTYVM